MGFPSPATDYIEDSINLNKLFIHHPAATSMIEHGGLMYIVDASLTPREGDSLCYEAFGEQGIGKLMGGCIVTPDGEAIEVEALSEVVVIGRVILTITQHYDFNGPGI